MGLKMLFGVSCISGGHSLGHDQRAQKVDEGRWGIGNKPQYSRAYTKDPLIHLLSSHLLSPPI